MSMTVELGRSICFLELAFDTVLHNKLLAVINNFSVNENLFRWALDYLNNRFQMVHINATLSDAIQFKLRD